MFEHDYRFRDDFPHYKEKLELVSCVYEVPVEFVWQEVEKLSDMQVPENRIWDIIVSRILNERTG